jgi:predicted nucleic acid-binding protein
MVYFDTSFLAPLILEEATSLAVERFIAGLPPATLSVSQWTRVEFASLLAREVRMGGLDKSSAEAAGSQFETIVAESFTVLLPTAADYNLARRYVQNYASSLRAGDALHLAIAKNHAIETVFSFDKTLLKAGALLGLNVSNEMSAAL